MLKHSQTKTYNIMKISKNLIALLIVAALGFALSCEENVAEPVNGASGTSILGDSTMTDDWQQVSVGDLPQTIQDFIAEEYEGRTAREAWLTDEGEYIVVMDRHLYLIFDNEGNFVEEYSEREHRGDRDPIDVSDLPQSVLDYLAANHPDAEIKKAFTNEDGEFIVKLDNRMVVIFDANGVFVDEFEKERRRHRGRFLEEWSRIDSSELPQAVLDYIASEHAGSEILITGINEEGEYGVVLSSGFLLLFDADGNLIEELTIDDLDWDDDYEDDWTEVNIDSLPQPIKDYVAANYADDTIEEAWYVEEEEIYILELSSDLYLVFDQDGNFIEEFEEDDRDRDHDDDWTEIDPNDIPDAAKDYLAANHADATIEEAYFDEKKERFIVELSTEVYVIFDIDGNHLDTRECDD